MAQNISTLEEQRYAPQPLYKIIAILCILFATVLGWELAQNGGPGVLLFLGVSLGITAWSVRAAFSYVELTPAGLCLVTLRRARRCVDFRHLVSVTENGRVNPVITVVYHPQLASGLLDLDDVATLQLPAVAGQAELLAHLQARVPV